MSKAHPNTRNAPAQAQAQAQTPIGASAVAQKAQKLMTVLFVLSLGIGLLAITGFATAAHDVAHDARHAFSVPCH